MLYALGDFPWHARQEIARLLRYSGKFPATPPRGGEMRALLKEVAMPCPALRHPYGSASRPLPPSSYEIKELSVHAQLIDQVSRSQVTQALVNSGTTAMEVRFVFPVPYDSVIGQPWLLVDGREQPANPLVMADTRRAHVKTVCKNCDQALLE